MSTNSSSSNDFEPIQPARFDSSDETPLPIVRKRRLSPQEARELAAKGEALSRMGDCLEDIRERMVEMRRIVEREAERFARDADIDKLRDNPEQAFLDAAADGRVEDIALLLRRNAVDLKRLGPRALALAEQNRRGPAAEALREAMEKSAPWWRRLFARKK